MVNRQSVPAPRRRGALVAITALLLAACSSDAPQGSGGPAGAGGGPPGGARAGGLTLAPEDVAVVARTGLEEGIAITGDLRPIETVNVRARLEGDVENVFVREGQSVRAGELLAVFESVEQESGRSSAVAERAAARSELSTAQWRLEQNQQLFREGAIAEAEVRTAQQAVASARARLAAAEARLRTSSTGVRDTRVLAPVSGIIERRIVQNGERVARGASMFTLVRTDVLELAANVPSRQANAVRAGQVVHFTADGRSFDGRVARVSPTIDPSTRAVTVYVQVPNATGLFKGGTFATGRVVSRTIPSALTIPTPAIRRGQDATRPFVYRITGDNKIDVANVRLGVVDERAAIAEVVEGLEAGDRVVVGNVGALGRGMSVSIIGGERSARGGAGPGGVPATPPAPAAGAPRQNQ